MTRLLSQRGKSLFNCWEHCYMPTAKPDNFAKFPSDRQPETRTSQLYIILMHTYLSNFLFSLLVSYIDKTL